MRLYSFGRLYVPCHSLSHFSGLDWSAEEEALINEFANILSTTPRELLVETTKKLLFSSEEDTVSPDQNDEEKDDFAEETTLVQTIGNPQSVDHAETPRTILSTTSRQGVNLDDHKLIVVDMDMSSSTPRIFTTSNRPTSFGDLLPRESVRPPKLKKAKSFEELLRIPKLLNDISDPFGSTIRSKLNEPTTTETMELEKRRQLIKEALDRIKKNREKFRSGGKMKFPPKNRNKGTILKNQRVKIRLHPVESKIYPTTPSKEEDKELEFLNVENKFADRDYDEQSTWGPVNHKDPYPDYSSDEYEYTTEYDEEYYEDDGVNLFTSQARSQCSMEYALGVLGIRIILQSIL